MNKNFETMTMAEIMEALKVGVDEYNLCEDARTRIQLAVEHKKACDKYNELSLLSTYAECMKSELPLKAFAETYYYDTISTQDATHTEVVDGKSHSSVTRSIKSGCKKMNLVKFIEWTEECNKSVAADTNWRVASEKARNEVISQWKKVFNSNAGTNSLSYTKIKSAMQDMFDALIFVEAPSGKNAIVADGKIARWVGGFANVRKDSRADDKTVNIIGTVMSKQTWATLQMDALHKAVTGKDFTILYGDEAPEEAEVETEATEQTEE